MEVLKHTELNNSCYTLFFGLVIYFKHCLGTGSTSDFHFEANGCSPLLMLIPFNGVHSVLVKDHVDLQTVVRKERGTEDVEIFFGELIKGICYRIFFHL